MALARSASGPAGLSINTGSANLFGTNTSQPPAGGGLFASATSQPAQTPSLFGTAPSQQQPQQAGGLFGATTTQTPANQQPQQSTPSLFGGTAAATTQPQQSTGLFGSTTAQQPQQSTPSLFGGATTTQQQPAQTGGLFGGATQTQTQPAQTGSLFGGSTAATGGMFGAKPAAASTTGGGLFGQQPTVGLTMGQSVQQAQQQNPQQPQQQTIPGVRIDLSNIRSTTRFNDLQESLQREIATIDEAIQKCIKDKEAVDAFLPPHGDQLAAIPTDVGFVSRKSEGAQAALASDVQAIDALRDLVRQDAGHARLSFRAVDNLKLPTQYHQAGLWSGARGGPHQGGGGAGASGAGGAANGSAGGGAGAAGSGGGGDAAEESNTDLISFFTRTAAEMDETMRRFERNLGEIEVHLHGVQGGLLEQMQRVAAAQASKGAGGSAGAAAGGEAGSGGGGRGVDERVVELAGVLRDFEEGILKVAGTVGGVREGVTELQLRDFMGHGS